MKTAEEFANDWLTGEIDKMGRAEDRDAYRFKVALLRDLVAQRDAQFLAVLRPFAEAYETVQRAGLTIYDSSYDFPVKISVTRHDWKKAAALYNSLVEAVNDPPLPHL